MSAADRMVLPIEQSVSNQREKKGSRWLLGEKNRSSRQSKWSGLIWIMPAFLFYAMFVLFPLIQSIRYSFYSWDGIGVATWVGLRNYLQVWLTPELGASIVHSFILVFFFTVIPVGLGLIAAAIIQRQREGTFNTMAKTILFLPQIVPLAGAGVMWTWMYAENGSINTLLKLVGLGFLAQPWLGDFSTALPAVGFIGVWVALGFCTVLLLSGIGKIDPSIYEAARIDGAGVIREFFTVTLPELRSEIVVAVTVTVIFALESFDVVYVSTNGGPGYQTMVPGVEIYRLTFTNQQVGMASALAVVLTALVLIVILPIQRLGRERN